MNDLINELANEIASKGIERSYNNGSSVDKERELSTVEKNIIIKIAKGALYAFANNTNKDKDAQGILHCAEDIFIQFFDFEFGDTHLNSYLTLYLPLKRAFKTIKEESSNV